MTGKTPSALTPTHQRALRRASAFLEDADFAAKLAEYAGQSVNRLMRTMPRPLSGGLNKAVEKAVLNCLNLAIHTLGHTPRRPSSRATAVLAGVSGGVSGFVGLAALPVELPLTTALILRAIAEIARHHGEDLSRLEARLACVEVLGLGSSRQRGQAGLGYYATRTLLGRLVGDASARLAERGLANASAPVMGGLAAEIAPRFGLVVSERAAASALPVIGALGGATVNFLFMKHFQQVAHGHFTVRRLERGYGENLIRREYERLSAGSRETRAISAR